MNRSQTFTLMGILNVTPDSFSDGGAYSGADDALAHAYRLVEQGADILDLGAESTRPGAQQIDAEQEWQRLQPVLSELTRMRPNGCRISVDTSKPEIIRRSLDLGVDVINNVEGLCDQTLLTEIAQSGASYLAMHMHGKPATMQHQPLSADETVGVVDRFFERASEELSLAGFGSERYWLDPGIGFGKTLAGNLRSMVAVARWASCYPVAVGVSRKGWLRELFDIEDPRERDHVSKAAEFGLYCAGARLIRTHEVDVLAKIRSYL